MPFTKGHKINVGRKFTLGKKIHSEEWKAKLSEIMKGNTRGFKKGHTSPRKGKKSRFPAWNKGKKMPERQGKNSWNWVEDRNLTMEKRRLRGSVDWRKWRESIFARDKYTCQECGKSGVYIEPHHIVPIKKDFSKMFDIANGITLCRPCHIKTMGKEASFADKYQSIINESIIPPLRSENNNH